MPLLYMAMHGWSSLRRGLYLREKIGNLLKHKMCLFEKAEGKKARSKLAFLLRFQNHLNLVLGRCVLLVTEDSFEVDIVLKQHLTTELH